VFQAIWGGGSISARFNVTLFYPYAVVRSTPSSPPVNPHFGRRRALHTWPRLVDTASIQLVSRSLSTEHEPLLKLCSNTVRDVTDMQLAVNQAVVQCCSWCNLGRADSDSGYRLTLPDPPSRPTLLLSVVMRQLVEEKDMMERSVFSSRPICCRLVRAPCQRPWLF
jgi:hypothetical protein